MRADLSQESVAIFAIREAQPVFNQSQLAREVIRAGRAVRILKRPLHGG
jgi:hypothetical protein